MKKFLIYLSIFSLNILFYVNFTFAQKDTIPVPVKLNSKWGYKSTISGNLLIPAMYDSASKFFGKFATVKSGSSWILIQNNRNYIVSTAYDSVIILPRTLILFKEGKSIFYDQDGKLTGTFDAFLQLNSRDSFLMEPLYFFVNEGGLMNHALKIDTISFIDPSDDLEKIRIEKKIFPYFKGGKIGILTGSGKALTPVQIQDVIFVAQYFTEMEDYKYYKTISIKLTDSVFFNTQYPIYSDFNHPFLVKQNNFWGIMSKRGSWIVRPQFDSLFYGFEGNLEGYFEGKQFIISSSGFVSPSYDASLEFRFSGGSDLDFYVICKEGKKRVNRIKEYTNFYSNDGESEQMEVIFDYPFFNEGYLGMIGVSGECYIEPVYDDILISLYSRNNYYEGQTKKRSLKDSTYLYLTTDVEPNSSVWVRKGSKYGLYKIKEKWLFPVKYDHIIEMKFKDSLFYVVRNNNKSALATSNGTFLTDFIFDFINTETGDDSATNTSRIKVIKDSKHGYLGLDGKIHISAENISVSQINKENFKFTKIGRIVYYTKIDTIDIFDPETGEQRTIISIYKDSIIAGAKYGICDYKGNIIIPDNFDQVGEINDLYFAQTGGADTIHKISTNIDSLKGKFTAKLYNAPDRKYNLYDRFGNILAADCEKMIYINPDDSKNILKYEEQNLCLLVQEGKYLLFNSRGFSVPVKEEWIPVLKDLLK
ncbi:MAG: hypothetical protein A2275_03505 [Bacteroidetes bacterium RIFOXYA12_FULL_35_11]|nr:MAG: hypothetical protein A2X01_05535 [Bacteroidetes bacterium GWF2_35_48]OFY81936.1 MAG: hypothetical protein A2275_03505 [Bacteroidetes bacterium RIFOXYA12_FULL_35_11]OFZ05911.1 MAG: hypothetical protein A2491_16455 [Bacteroidetes bacterium RIFOXYC12_FULL_35_7]HBX52217.1 hypothetical protein [Bacteroidales bacterium]